MIDPDDDSAEDLPVLYRLRVRRGSPDLGMDAGTELHVVNVRKDGTLDALVPCLDAMISGLDAMHPDLELIPEQLPLPIERHDDCDCSRCLPPTY